MFDEIWEPHTHHYYSYFIYICLYLFGKELLDFCHNANLVITDVAHCDNASYTFFSTAHYTVSWLDHILGTYSAHNIVKNVSIDYSKVSSDHHPILFYINVNALTHVNESTDMITTRKKKSVKSCSL